MQTAPLLPSTAPFQEEQIAALNRVISVTTAEQRAWLSGYLAGLQAANDPQAATPSAPPVKRAPLTILFGTESGNAEALAAQARKAAAKLGFAAKVVDMADFTPAQAASTENLLIVASTWGEGDPPQRAVDFYEALMAEDAPRFEKTRFAVLALGDRAYAQFCEIGRKIDERLAALGGARIADRIECDLDLRNASERLDRHDAGAAERRSRRQGGGMPRLSMSISPALAPMHRPAPGRSRLRSPSMCA